MFIISFWIPNDRIFANPPLALLLSNLQESLHQLPVIRQKQMRKYPLQKQTSPSKIRWHILRNTTNPPRQQQRFFHAFLSSQRARNWHSTPDHFCSPCLVTKKTTRLWFSAWNCSNLAASRQNYYDLCTVLCARQNVKMSLTSRWLSCRSSTRKSRLQLLGR